MARSPHMAQPRRAGWTRVGLPVARPTASLAVGSERLHERLGPAPPERALLGWGTRCTTNRTLRNLALPVPEHQETLTPSLSPSSPRTPTIRPPRRRRSRIPRTGSSAPRTRCRRAGSPASPGRTRPRTGWLASAGTTAPASGWSQPAAGGPSSGLPVRRATCMSPSTLRTGLGSRPHDGTRVHLAAISSPLLLVPDDETLSPPLSQRGGHAEDLTESLGRAGQGGSRACWWPPSAVGTGRLAAAPAVPVGNSPAAEVYKAALATQLRILFVFFAEEKRATARRTTPVTRGLFGRRALCRARSSGPGHQRRGPGAEQSGMAPSGHSSTPCIRAWTTLISRCAGTTGASSIPVAILGSNRRGGSPWPVDDRTVLHMLRAVQYVTTSVGAVARAPKDHIRAVVGSARSASVYEGFWSTRDGARPTRCRPGRQPGREVQVELAESSASPSSRRGQPDPLSGWQRRYADTVQEFGSGYRQGGRARVIPPAWDRRTRGGPEGSY